MTEARTQIRAVLGWVALHVADVERSLAFYERAFGLRRRFVDERGIYGELETGATTLSVTEHEFARELAGDTAASGLDVAPPPVELALVVEDVPAAVDAALAAGAVLVRPPATRYWGQIVAHVRDPDGHLVQIATSLDA